MPIEHQILSATSNGPKSSSMWLLLKQNNAVRKTEIVLKDDEDADTVITARLSELWGQAEIVPDGVQAWFAYRQRQSNEFLNKVIFAVFVQVQQGADLPTILGAANMVLNDDPDQKAIFQSLHLALKDASDAHLRQFIALAFTVAFGKLGQR